jgi:hypothetical protein
MLCSGQKNQFVQYIYVSSRFRINPKNTHKNFAELPRVPHLVWKSRISILVAHMHMSKIAFKWRISKISK